MTGPFPSRRAYRLSLPRGGTLILGERPLVMGILNVTPDSFGDRVALRDPAAAVDAALRMEAEGADMIDLGGESTRPGAVPVPAEEEAARILPVLRGLAGRLHVPLSVDTYKAFVARIALNEGAVIVNDVSGLRYEPELAEVASKAGAVMVLMHMRGRSREMYDLAHYDDLTADIVRELKESIGAAAQAGIPVDRIIVDPGIGFAKRAADSYGVLAGLGDIAASLDRPLLAGPSRKSFLREATGDRPAVERDWGTAAAVAAAVLAGAHIVRVHAVAEMAQVVRVAEEIRRHSRSPS